MPDTSEGELTGTSGIPYFPADGRIAVDFNLLQGPGLCHFFRGFNRSGRIGVGRQLVTMGVRVRSMPERKGWFRNGLMLPVRQGIFRGVMTGIFQVTFTILARPGFHGGFFLTFLSWRRLSWGHIQ